MSLTNSHQADPAHVEVAAIHMTPAPRWSDNRSTLRCCNKVQLTIGAEAATKIDPRRTARIGRCSLVKATHTGGTRAKEVLINSDMQLRVPYISKGQRRARAQQIALISISLMNLTSTGSRCLDLASAQTVRSGDFAILIKLITMAQNIQNILETTAQALSVFSRASIHKNFPI